jgi:hypothetical protein
MSWPRLQGPESHVELSSWDVWFDMLALARDFGWRPSGSFISGLGPHWTGAYQPTRFYATMVREKDATALGEALSHALAELPQERVANSDMRRQLIRLPAHATADPDRFIAAMSRLSGHQRTFTELIDLCHDGPFQLTVAKDTVTPDYCWCTPSTPWRAEFFEHLDWASVNPWSPDASFPCWVIFWAVRHQLQHECAVRHFESRVALAQAVCGHLDRNVDDALLPDAHLVSAVGEEYFGEPWLGARGAWPLIRQARQRVAWTPRTTGLLPVASGRGPWWRAARVLRDRESALHAAAMEFLWLRRSHLNVRDRQAGAGFDPATAIPALDLEEVQREAFGDDRSHWPLPDLRALHRAPPDEEPNLGSDSALAELHAELSGECPAGEDIAQWERLSGLSAQQLFPERS